MAISASASPSPSIGIPTRHRFARKITGAVLSRPRSQISAQSHPQQDPYSTLGVPYSASPEEIKKAHRRLALKFHPDVCKSDSCTSKFIQIEQAYETIMDCLQGKQEVQLQYESMQEGMMGVYDESWEDWEEWMGWEGAGTRDYTSHINHSL